MLRKIMIGLTGAASIAVVAVMAMPADASARGGHGGWHGGHGGWHGGYRGGYYRGGYYGYGYPYAYNPYASCYRNVRVATPYGWGWQRVYVCG